MVKKVAAEAAAVAENAIVAHAVKRGPVISGASRNSGFAFGYSKGNFLTPNCALVEM